MVHLMALVIGNYTNEMNTSCTTYSLKHLIGRLPGGKRRSLQRGRLSLGRGGLCEGSLKRSGRPQIHGPRWNAPTNAEGAGRCHCWATLHHLWKVLENRRGARGLEGSQCHSNLQKGQEGGPRELQTGQAHLHPRKDDGAAYSGSHHQASGGKGGYRE